MGSRKSAIQGNPERRESVAAIVCAVAIGYVDQIAVGRYFLTSLRPARTPPNHHDAHRSGLASTAG